MNHLTDKEVLELSELCNAVADGTLTDAQRARLSGWLTGSEAARQYYVRAMGLSASLFSYASEMQAEAPDAVRPGHAPRRLWWWLSPLAAAASVALVLALTGRWSAPEESATVKGGEFVAQLTASKECRWGAAAMPAGARLRKGQRLELAGGLAEITFDSGAQIVLEGPASLDVNSAWDTTLRRGALKASVPREAIGFRISNSAVDVVDLGTEFTMIADANGTADVLVLKGEIEATPRNDSDQETILLRKNESRRFDQTGVSHVSDSARKFALFTQPMALDRFAQTTKYVHWSFDEADGNLLHADVSGAPDDVFDAQLVDIDSAAIPTVRSSGYRSRALKFDGRLFAKASFPGLSAATPHTVAFWVKVPENAQLSDAYSMIAWRPNSEKLAFRPVHIGWNRNPNEGALGALRTDFGGGCALGTTPLRDGRWHHIAVVFVPGEDASTPVQVKQYVDGRLESSTIIPGKTHGPAGPPQSALADTLWLGCRLGFTGPRTDRFRGEIDELFVAERGLEPYEIVQLMKDNRLASPATMVAAVAR